MTRRFLIAAAIAVLAPLPLSARTHVWTGTASGLFSDHRNWQGGSPAGDAEAELVFPLAVRQSVENDLLGLTVKSITFESDGYRIGGNAITLVEGAEIEAGDVEFACELLFDGAAVEKPSKGHFTYSRVKPARVAPASAPAAHAQSSVFTFEDRAVTARVTPGAETAWHFDGYRRQGNVFSHELHQTLMGDTDDDGQVRWPLSFEVPFTGVWCVVDQAARIVHAATSDGAAIDVAPLDINFLRDRDGNYAWADARNGRSSDLRLLWIRPGVGAWRLRGHSTSGEDERTLLTMADALPVGGSPAPPAGVLAGDFFIATEVSPVTTPRIYGGLVDGRLEASAATPAEIGLIAGRATEDSPNALVAVMRIGSADKTSTVRYTTEDITANAGIDYEPVEGTLTFKRGEVRKTIAVPLIEDDICDGGITFRMKLSDATGATIRTASALTVIVDDEPLPTVDIANKEVNEGDAGEQEAEVEVTLAGKTALPITVTWRAVGGVTATGELTFAPGEMKKVIPIRYLGNAVADGDRQVNLSITSSTNVLWGRTGKLVILDDDSLVIAASDVKLDEANTEATVVVTLGAAQPVPISLDYFTQPSGYTQKNQDYIPVQGKLTFDPGQIRKEIVIAVRQDDVAEDDETIILVLTGAAAAGRTLRNGSVTIRDDGDFPTITADDVTVAEGKFAQFVIIAEPTPEKTIRLNVTPVSGTAVLGIDVQARIDWLDEPGVIERGGAYAVAYVGVYPDTEVEMDETFTVRISSAADPSTVRATAQGIVKDLNSLYPHLSVSGASAREGDAASFNVMMSSTSAKPVSFRVRTVGDTAEEGRDFEAVSNVYTIEPGELGTTIEVKVLEDLDAERHETFAVELSQPWNAAIGVGVGRGRIFDDDDPEVPVFGVSNVSVSEEAGVARFTVTLARAMSARTSISFGTVNGTAIAGEDYQASHGALTFEPGETSKTVDVTILDDQQHEADEAFTLRLTNGLEATATIVNDDAKARSRSVRH